MNSLWHAVDPSKWLQTPTGEEEVFDDDALTSNGWFPEANLAGIACKFCECPRLSKCCIVC